MAKVSEVFKCTKCGSMVVVREAGTCNPVCCGEPMQEVKAGTVDAAREKHVPVIEKIADGYKVTVGSVAHPMEEKHHISWIELLADNESHTRFLKPGEKPEAVFKVNSGKVVARAYCNLHGLWQAEN